MTTDTWIAIGDSFNAGTSDDQGGWIARTHATLTIRGLIGTFDNRPQPDLLIADMINTQTPHTPQSRVVSAIAGANDILHPRCDIDLLLEQVDRILDHAVEHGDFVLTSTCPDFNLNRPTTSRRLAERIDALNEAVQHRASAGQLIELVPAHEIMSDVALWSSDGIHPNPAGHQKLADAATALLTPRLINS